MIAPVVLESPCWRKVSIPGMEITQLMVQVRGSLGAWCSHNPPNFWGAFFRMSAPPKSSVFVWDGRRLSSQAKRGRAGPKELVSAPAWGWGAALQVGAGGRNGLQCNTGVKWTGKKRGLEVQWWFCTGLGSVCWLTKSSVRRVLAALQWFWIARHCGITPSSGSLKLKSLSGSWSKASF